MFEGMKVVETWNTEDRMLRVPSHEHAATHCRCEPFVRIDRDRIGVFDAG